MSLDNIYPPSTTSQPGWGTFISSNPELQNSDNLHELLKIRIFSGHKADFSLFSSQNMQFDIVASKIAQQRDSLTFEDQCSGKYYFDIFNVIQASLNNVNRIAEVGVYTGGSSCVIAGCIEDTDTELDLIDMNRAYLLFTYERIRRLFPKTAARTRLFFGDLPTYVKNVMLNDHDRSYLVHHDAAHTFNLVLRDLASLSFVKDRTHGLLIQDTHLRGGNINSFLFVDAALFAVFGDGMRYKELGTKFLVTTQPAYQYCKEGTYFNANQAEGMFIPFSLTNFRYPHPSTKLESFFE